MRELRIDQKLLRALFPQDGEVITTVLKSDVWTHNSDPFFRHETLEFSLGKGIRAKLDDRHDEKSLTPSVVFNNGHIDLQAGWRLHKQVKYHTDLFDGVMRGRVFMAYAGGKAAVNSQFSIDWNKSKAAKVMLGVGDGFEIFLTGIAESKLEEAVNKNAAGVIDGAINDLLKKNGLPVSLRSHVYAEVVRGGLRVRLYENPLVAKDVRTPNFDFRLAKTGAGDGDFGGHGPKITIESDIRNSGNKVYMKLSMEAKETKSDWTAGKGAQEFMLYTIPRDEVFVGVIGGNSTVLVKDFVMSGHGARPLETTFLGTFSVVGDTSRDDDVPVNTGIKLAKASQIRILTMKRN